MEKSHVMASTFVHPEPGSRLIGVTKKSFRNISANSRRPPAASRASSGFTAPLGLDMEFGKSLTVPSVTAANLADVQPTGVSITMSDSADLGPHEVHLSGLSAIDVQGAGAKVGGSLRLPAAKLGATGVRLHGMQRANSNWRRIGDALREEGSRRGAVSHGGGDSLEASMHGPGGTPPAQFGLGTVSVAGTGTWTAADANVGSSIYVDYDGDVFQDGDSVSA